MIDQSYYKKICECISSIGEKPELKTVKNAKGLSGAKNLKLIQNLASTVCSPERAYMEVGVFRGMTLSHAAISLPENARAYGIDNFSLFDREKKNRTIIADLLAENHLSNVTLIDEDYEVVLRDASAYIPTPVGFYNIDGPHDYRSQMMCLLLAKDILAEGAVIIVDDSNYAHVRQANHDFLASHPDYTLLFETYTDRHPDNQENLSTATSGWWNGVNLIVKDSQRLLPRMFPTTFPGKQLFYNDHAVHSHGNAYMAPHLLLRWSALRRFDLKWYFRSFVLMRREKKAYTEPKDPYLLSNTRSESLKTQINPGLL